MTVTVSKISEKRMLALILEKLDHIETRLIEQYYPEEESIKEELIKKVEAAEERASEGKVKHYTPEQFKREFSV